MNPRLHLLVLTLFATSCSDYSTVSDRKPVFQPLHSTAAAVSKKAGQAGKRDPINSLGDYLSAAQAAERYLKNHPDNHAALGSYHFAVARIFSCPRDAQNAPWAQPLRVPSDSGEYVVDYRPNPRKRWNPSLYDNR